jgi:hypothetical protein
MRPLSHRLRSASCLLVAVGTIAVIPGCGGGGTNKGQAAVASAQALESQAEKAIASGTASSAATPADTAGAAGAAGGGGSGKGVCRLLSVQQASSLEQQNYVAAEARTVGPIATCDYEKQAGHLDVNHDLSVGINKTAGCWTSDTADAKSIPGVGDAAVGSVLGVSAKHGSTCVEISGDVQGDSQGDFGRDAAVAKAVVGQLG